jgi:hypothetical protein
MCAAVVLSLGCSSDGELTVGGVADAGVTGAAMPMIFRNA